MKGISKTTHAGLGPLIPAVFVPPEVLAQAPQGFIRFCRKLYEPYHILK
jgi:hypothetical protein